MQRLEMIREKAEAAHLEVVVQTMLLKQLEKERRSSASTQVRVQDWKMAEQKLLREMEWILDRLDKSPKAPH